MDPIQGGTPNAYVYPVDPVNPVNDFDITGMFYTNFNLGACDLICLNMGVMKASSGGWYYSGGIGVGARGPGASLTYGAGKPSSGVSVGASGGYGGMTGSVSVDKRGRGVEVGGGTPGWQIGIQYTTKLSKCTLSIGKCGGTGPTFKQNTKLAAQLRNGKLKKQVYVPPKVVKRRR